MYNNPSQYPYLLSPSNATPPNPNSVQAALPPNSNGYHTTNIMPPNIGSNTNAFTPMIPSYARPPQGTMNTSMYNCNTFNAPPAPNMFGGNALYSQSGPPQFVTIVNKATNYISSSPYSLITPQHHTHTHAPPLSQHLQPPSSPASSTCSKLSDEEEHKSMLQHVGLSPTKHGNNLWKQCFENISYHQLSMNEHYSDYDQEPPATHQEINITLCNKCEELKGREDAEEDAYIEDDGDDTKEDHDAYCFRSNTVSSSLLCYNAHHDPLRKDYYHDSCFHFIFGIQNLGVFEFCKYCFMDKKKKQHTTPSMERKTDTEHSPFHLDTYLNDTIAQELHHRKREEKDTASVEVELDINELVAHCKQCGMTDSFVDELRACYADNPVPYCLMDLQSMRQITHDSKHVRVSIEPHAHIHCIVYHPKIGCMEFCGSCNKMRCTFCDNPLTLNKQSISNLVRESKMQSNALSLSKALRRLFNFHISRYKDTSLCRDIDDYYPCEDNKEDAVHLNLFSSLRSYMDLNKRLNLAIPKPAGPLAPHAMLRMKSLSGTGPISHKPHRNRSSSTTTPLPLQKQLSNDGTKSHHSAQSASFNRYKHQNHPYGSKRRHKCSPQHYRYRYNKRRAAYFNKHKKEKSEFTTHNIICMTPRTPSSPYPESMHSYVSDAEGAKCGSVPPLPLTPMLRANSASDVTPNVNYGRPISMIPMCHKVNTVELAQSVRSLGEHSQAPSETPVHSVQNGLNPAWSNPYATGSIIDNRNGPGSFNDAASLSSLPMSPTFSYTSLPNFPVSPFVYNSASNVSHHSSSDHHSDLLNPVELLNLQFNALTNNNNHRLHQFLNKNQETKEKAKKKEKQKAKEVKETELKRKEKEKEKEREKEKEKEKERQESHSTTAQTSHKETNQSQQNKEMTHANMKNQHQISYPMNLINVNSGPTSLQTTPLQLKPPFIPLSTVPQYYVLNKDISPSCISQLPQHIQVQLMQQGLPQNALILPIHQMQNFKKLLHANKNNANFMANLSNHTSHQHHNINVYGNNQNDAGFGDNANDNNPNHMNNVHSNNNNNNNHNNHNNASKLLRNAHR